MSNTMDIDKLGFFHWQINEALNNASQVILSRFRREHLLQGSPRHSDVEFLEASKETGLMVNGGSGQPTRMGSLRSKSDILSFPSFFSPFLGIGLFAMIILRYILLQFNFFPTQLVDVVAS
ncbi:hypothetical protein F5051DRAFT_434102 [Lentinula edodes]|nr:hypothetical protein F5051DRAFT_434102 [Lentinula edodes]